MRRWRCESRRAAPPKIERPQHDRSSESRAPVAAIPCHRPVQRQCRHIRSPPPAQRLYDQQLSGYEGSGSSGRRPGGAGPAGGAGARPGRRAQPPGEARGLDWLLPIAREARWGGPHPSARPEAAPQLPGSRPIAAPRPCWRRRRRSAAASGWAAAAPLPAAGRAAPLAADGWWPVVAILCDNHCRCTPKPPSCVPCGGRAASPGPTCLFACCPPQPQYQVGDTVTLWVNKVGPYNNPQETCECPLRLQRPGGCAAPLSHVPRRHVPALRRPAPAKHGPSPVHSLLWSNLLSPFIHVSCRQLLPAALLPAQALGAAAAQVGRPRRGPAGAARQGAAGSGGGGRLDLQLPGCYASSPASWRRVHEQDLAPALPPPARRRATS